MADANDDAPKPGRPRTMEDPENVTFVLDRVHRDYIDAFAERWGITSRSEALRAIIETVIDRPDAALEDRV